MLTDGDADGMPREEDGKTRITGPGCMVNVPYSPEHYFMRVLPQNHSSLGIRIHGQGIPCRVGAAKNAIIDGGYDPIYGARPLKRYIQAHVETMIAKEIGAHAAGDTLTMERGILRPHAARAVW